MWHTHSLCFSCSIGFLDRKRFLTHLVFSSGYALYPNTRLSSFSGTRKETQPLSSDSAPSLVAQGNCLKGTMCPAGWGIIRLSWTLDGVSGPVVQSVFSGPGWFWLMISRRRELICTWPIKERPRAHRHWWHTHVPLPSVCHWCQLDTGGQRRCVWAGEIFTRCHTIISHGV